MYFYVSLSRTMTNRPCKPNTEMQWLWRVLMPDTPLPGCGLPEATSASIDADGADDRTEIPGQGNGDTQQRRKT
jgi:hypothetical protein